MTVFTRALLCSALLTMGIAGCSSQSEEVSPELRSSVLSLVQDPPEVYVAQQYFSALCMRDAGFEVPVDLRVKPSTTVFGLVGVVGVFESIDAAKAGGYESSESGADQSPAEEYLATLSESRQKEYQQVELGDQTKTATYTLPSGSTATTTSDGCWGKSLKAVYGSAVNYLKYTGLRNELAPQVNLAKVNLDATLSAYSECMAKSGYQTAGLAQTQKMAADQFGNSRPLGSSPSKAEEELAVSDATCQMQVDLAGKLNEIFFEQAGAWVQQNQSWILGINELKAAALVSAKAILERAA